VGVRCLRAGKLSQLAQALLEAVALHP
jgi:hypothetical protein